MVDSSYIYLLYNCISQNQVIPWKSILLSLPVWAIVVAHFCENWGFYTMLTELPTFLNDIMHYNLYKVSKCQSCNLLYPCCVLTR